MTYKLQASSEETARISVTDTYGILPIANELLIALTYEGADSDHVADALAQFELQAIDLSHSLGGDLTNSFNEQLQQQHSQIDDDNYHILNVITPILDNLLKELSHGYINKDAVTPLLDNLEQINLKYVETYVDDEGMDAPLMDRIEEERLLIQTAEDANIGNKTIFTSIIESMKYDYSQLEHA
ncbi:hypothetical protein JK159_07590 [Weissella minor]|uniref:hypothetical protein n=1 Tax=Weissella minor TaxID=1620 RepID=UPI001BB06FEA|nr:hypothetical protein [Weissella minor]MBS0950223.1 hypothetical protein [Weissella minor]